MKKSSILLLAAALLSIGCVQEDGRENEVVYLNLTVSSPAFGHMQRIPVEFTCDGRGTSPPLNISGIPNGTKSLALIVEDPDAPLGTWDHWVVYNIPPTEKIVENTTPGTEGMNSFNRKGYGGPCPPFGTHRYVFSVYALDTLLTLKETAGKKETLEAMKGHILAKGQLIGVYNH